METIILFFGTAEAYERFKYDTIDWYNVKFVLCRDMRDTRAINFNGYIVHFSAPDSLRRDINEPRNQSMLRTIINQSSNANNHFIR